MAVDRVSWRSKSVLASLSVRRSGTGAYPGFRSIKTRRISTPPWMGANPSHPPSIQFGGRAGGG